MEFWEAMLLTQKIYFCIGLAASVFLILQIITLLFGIGDNGEVDIGDGNYVAVLQSSLPRYTVNNLFVNAYASRSRKPAVVQEGRLCPALFDISADPAVKLTRRNTGLYKLSRIFQGTCSNPASLSHLFDIVMCFNVNHCKSKAFKVSAVVSASSS